MTLDSLLTEVGPILGSSGQFSHPSFGEVLAARQLAEEINSGSLSIKSAYLNLWSEPPMFDHASSDFRTIRPEQRPMLGHLSQILSDKDANALVRIASDSCLVYEKRFGFFSNSGVYWSVMEDMSFCCKVIGEHSSLDSDERTKQIIDVLMGLLYECVSLGCSLDFNEYIKHYEPARDALIKTKSSYAATRLLEYASSIGHTSEHEYTYPSHKSFLGLQASIALEGIVKKGVKFDETALIEDIDSRKDINYYDVSLLLKYGGVKSFRHVVRTLADRGVSDSFKDERLFEFLLQGIKKYEFEPQLIHDFNNVVSKISSDNNAIGNYYEALKSFARFFKPLFGKDLYDYLETKGIQFSNSRVYKPK